MEPTRDCTLRAATNADGPAIVALVTAVLIEYGLPPDPHGTDADLADVEGNFVTDGGTFEVIESADGTIVGTVGLHPHDPAAGVCELRKMYLHPDWRGRGLGKLLLQRMIDHAGSAGFVEIEIETTGVLKEAIALYERFGFQRVSRRPRAARADQAYVLRLS